MGEENIKAFADLLPSEGQRPGQLSSRKRRSKEIKLEVAGSHSGPPPVDEPSIRNEFGAALFRFGHSTQANLLTARNKDFQAVENRFMRSNWFDPQMLDRNSPAALVRGGMMIPAANMSPKWVDDTVHFFFQPFGFKSGVDLMAINIQRGRDHGINSYTATRDACSSQARFAHLYNADGTAKMRPSWTNVINFYGLESEIDLYVGMLMEEPVPGAAVGPTTMCGIVDQFTALKLGDKHWYENDDMFTAEQLAEIKKMTLGNVFCHGFSDEDFSVTHRWPLKLQNKSFAGQANGRVACSSLESFDFEPWKPTPTTVSCVSKLALNKLKFRPLLLRPLRLQPPQPRPLRLPQLRPPQPRPPLLLRPQPRQLLPRR